MAGITALAGACTSEAGAHEPSSRVEVRVELAEVRRVSSADTIELHGTTRSSERATLAFAVGGRLRERVVDVGDRVRAGQVLAQLDASGYANGVAAAEATVRELEARREQLVRDEARVTTLREGGVVGDAQLEEVRTGVVRIDESLGAATVAAREARRQRGESVLRAPFDGVVRAVFADEGTVVGPGTPLLLLAGDGATEIALDLPERAARWARVGSAVEVRLPTSDERHVGTLVAAADAAGPNGLFPARVTLPDAVELASGRGVIVRLTSSDPVDELRVPVRAIVDPSGDRPFVWQVDADGVVTRVDVRLGALRDATANASSAANAARRDDPRTSEHARHDEAEVTLLEPSPLTEGARVVVAGHRSVLDGDRVVSRSEPPDRTTRSDENGARANDRPEPRTTEVAR
ncbi:MAG: efflux RND transporter periplasmic adaptor subunit [Myxococcota bacterium]|nr:efflux RND transporter periplasmic adaptor subunit [Myxococcota bacterium]